MMNKPNRKHVQIFLLTYNRPLMVCEAIDSILSQTYRHFTLIVSDNSTNNHTKDVLDKNYRDQFLYIRRNPSLSADDHFKIILEEVNTEYFLIFHDDDIMLPNMIETLINQFRNTGNVNLLAVGSNAWIKKNNAITRRFRLNINHDLLISCPTQLAKLYSVRNRIVPFASYLYKEKVAKLVSLDLKKGGKYCDVAYLLDITCVGNILNLEEPLMLLNQHQGQDSATHVYKDYSRLISYIISITNSSRRDDFIINLRLLNLYGEISNYLLENRLKIFEYKYLKIILIFVKNRRFDYAFRILWRSVRITRLMS